ncbi:MAG: hypothetical protein LUC93_11350 [Planctomycetaceae bacterium]|nr:hypothetical protein [Planctomycetaceae bacterium]
MSQLHLTLRTACIAAVVMLLTGLSQTAFAATYSQRVDKGMALINVFPGLTETSTPLSITIRARSIPDNAVVEKVEIVTGRIQKDRRATGVNAITSYNLQAPGAKRPIKKRWGGANLDTTFTADELGDDIPVKGTWRLSMTGNNVGRTGATTNHTIEEIIITYSVPEE